MSDRSQVSLSTAQPDASASDTDAPVEEPPAPSRRPSWLFAAAAVLIGLIWPGGRSNLLADAAIELAMIGLLFVAVTRTSTFQNWWHDIPRTARRTATFVIAAIVCVQFFSIAANAFPLTEWTMYTRTTPTEAVAYNFVGYTADGDEVTFIPTVTNRTLTTKMATSSVRVLVERRLRATADGTDPGLIDEITQELDHAVGLLAELHNERSPARAVTTVTIFRTTFTHEQRRTGDGDTRTVWTQDIASGEASTP